MSCLSLRAPLAHHRDNVRHLLCSSNVQMSLNWKGLQQLDVLDASRVYHLLRTNHVMQQLHDWEDVAWAAFTLKPGLVTRTATLFLYTACRTP